MFQRPGDDTPRGNQDGTDDFSVISRHDLGDDELAASGDFQVRFQRKCGDQSGNRARVFRESPIDRVCEWRATVPRDQQEPLWISNSQWPEQHGVDDADNRRVHANAKAQGEDDDRRESAVVPKRAECTPKSTPECVRLGRWLFFDTRLSSDHTISCATCHQPEHALSQLTPVASGVGGATGTRKTPTIVNLAIPRRWSFVLDVPPGAFFWDGRARTLEEQALEPIANPAEMANEHPVMVATLRRISGYGRYFGEAFGDGDITKERIAHAIADYVRTRMSGNSPFDRWRRQGDESAVSEQVLTAGCVMAASIVVHGSGDPINNDQETISIP